jgi:TetR/AcrR family transcriptional regulator
MNPGADRLPRRRDEARALFRNAILESAEAVFAERGFHGARIQDIAQRARIAVGTVYNHFEHKDEVLFALLEERTEELLAQLLPMPGDPRSFPERLTVRVARVLGYVLRHRAFFTIANEHGLFAGAAPAQAPTSSRRLRQLEKFRTVFRALVKEGVASGDLERLEVDALVRFLGGTIRAFMLSSLADQTTDADDQARTVVDLFLHGAGKRKSRRTR